MEKILKSIINILYDRKLNLNEISNLFYDRYPELAKETYFVREKIINCLKSNTTFFIKESGDLDCYSLTEEGNKEYKKNIEISIEETIWNKFTTTQYHVEFFRWLHENYEIKPKKHE